jgi:hypothetical protein
VGTLSALAVRDRAVHLPSHVLAGLDDGRSARRFAASAKIFEGSDDDDEQSEDGNQIDLSGVVTVVADFPAHG